MVGLKEVDAKEILDSRGEKTVLVTIKTNRGKKFSASSPTGKSTGKYEKKSYKKSLKDDIKKIKEIGEYLTCEDFSSFESLKQVEDVCDEQVGANSVFALESCVLKAMADESEIEIWQLINAELKKQKEKKFPEFVGNCVGGGKHSKMEEGIKKPDFQEFLIISEDSEINKKVYKEAEELIKEADEKFKSEKNDESAWKTSLNEKIILDILSRLKEKYSIKIGLDIAASSFYKRKKYNYDNPKLKRTPEEQLFYIENLIKNYDLFYVEDAFEEEDFDNFAKLKEKFPKSLIVGDDLIVTNPKRLEKAIKKKAVNAVIVKPNQIGSLLKVKEICEMAKKNKIKLVFSHRSGETEENILADLAFGFGADFFKVGISGKEREAKIDRMNEIMKSFKQD